MILLIDEHHLSHITGGQILRVFSGTYTSLATLLTQQPMNLFEATRFYQQLGQGIGEFVYTILHPEDLDEQLYINLNES